MVQIITEGRQDLKELFSISGIFNGGKLNHTPFLVFTTQDDTIRVHIVDTPQRLLAFPDETPVMVQWRGNWRSDFFQFKVEDYRLYIQQKEAPSQSN